MLYLPDLAGAPYYLNRDEMFFGLTAHSLATTGVDANGHYLPLYTQSPMRYGSEMWFQPALMYSAALSVKLFGLSEGTVRLPMTLMAIIDVVLMYFVARRLFKRELPAIGAAILLAVTPAHYIHSRVAMDFQAPLPFLLAWLLFALTYFDERRVGWLVAAGLSLGLGLYTYIAAYMWMPVYGILTVIALLVRRDSIGRTALFVGACAVPALLCIPFLLSHPTVIRDVMWHYDREQPQTAAGADLFLTYFDVERFGRAAMVYARFWSPRFLFIDGPNALWSAGVFLLPMAGLVVVGIAVTLRRARPESILLLGGLLTAAIPASLVGDLDAIHRASAVLPFAVLIAVTGLESLRHGTSAAMNTIAFVAIWSVMIVLASAFHGQFPLAQASIRAATVPLATSALCALLWSSGHGVLGRARFWLVAGAAAGLMQIAYVAVGFDRVAWMSAIVSAAALLASVNLEPGDNRRSVIAGALLATAFSHFMFAHAEFSIFRRIGFIPATAVIMTVRFLYTCAALAVFVAIYRRVFAARSNWREPAMVWALAFAVIAVQAAYFHVSYFTDHRLRTAHAFAVIAGIALVVALTMRSGSFMSALPRLAAAGVLGAMTIQFAYFSADFFTRYRAHAGHFDTEGNQRIVWEAVADEATRRQVPAIYMGSVGPYGFADLYWQFYATKRNRLDLLSRTTADPTLDLQRVRALPPLSLVVTSPSPEIDDALTRLTTAGEVRSRKLLVAPDGRSKFWLIETGPGS